MVVGDCSTTTDPMGGLIGTLLLPSVPRSRRTTGLDLAVLFVVFDSSTTLLGLMMMPIRPKPKLLRTIPLGTSAGRASVGLMTVGGPLGEAVDGHVAEEQRVGQIPPVPVSTN